MKITVITGSAHKSGTTAVLAEEFIKGAKEAGHEVFRFDAAFKSVHPCIGCEKCHKTGTCAFSDDDMKELNPHLLEAEGIVFVSPVYYLDVNAQLKAVIDRFYANDAALHGGKKAALMVALADSSPRTAAGAVGVFHGIAGYLQWDIAGIVTALGCPAPQVIGNTDYPKQAYELGKNFAEAKLAAAAQA